MHLTDPDYAQVDAVQAEYPTDKRNRAYEPPEPYIPPDPDQLEQTPEYRGHLVADNREDQGVDEVALAEYAAEEAHGLQDDPLHGGDEGLDGVGVEKLGASGAAGRP